MAAQHRTTLWILLYFGLLIGGLSTMLLDELGWVAFTIYCAGMPLGALLLWRLCRGSFSIPGILPYRGVVHHFILGTTGSLAAVLLVYGALRAAGWLHVTTLNWTIAGLVIGVAAQQFVVAVIEEFTFRGVIQTLFSHSTGPSRGLLIASSLFGLFHLPNILHQGVRGLYIPLTVAVLTLMGIVFGWAFARTNQHLALPVALHFGWNTACFGLEAVHDFSFSGPGWLTGVAEWFPESSVMGALGLGVLGLLVHRLTLKPLRVWNE
jgi:membrane protease YdiL (CAAX protease family)